MKFTALALPAVMVHGAIAGCTPNTYACIDKLNGEHLVMAQEALKSNGGGGNSERAVFKCDWTADSVSQWEKMTQDWSKKWTRPSNWASFSKKQQKKFNRDRRAESTANFIRSQHFPSKVSLSQVCAEECFQGKCKMAKPTKGVAKPSPPAMANMNKNIKVGIQDTAKGPETVHVMKVANAVGPTGPKEKPIAKEEPKKP